MLYVDFPPQPHKGFDVILSIQANMKCLDASHLSN